MNIAVIGSGYVGLVSAACLAELGHNVTCVDIDHERIASLQRGEVPIFEELLPELLERHRGKSLAFTHSLKDAVEASSAIFIAVGTPSAENGESDLSYVEAVARDVAQLATGYKVLVEKSTVPVCTCDWIQKIVARSARFSELEVASNPEFLREGTAVSDFLCPDRIVVGCDSARAADLMQEIYRPLSDGSYYKRSNALCRKDHPARLIATRTKSAELIKHAANAFLALKISFINAVANICENVDADIAEVCRGIGSDERIGNRFLNPGIGYGGSCFPKDLRAFQKIAEETGYEFHLLREVIEINEEQRRRFLRKVRSAVWNLAGKRIGVLGLAFKGGTDDVRESPALAVIRELVKARCTVVAYDPAATGRARRLLGDLPVKFASSAYNAAEDADVLLILTDWDEFRNLDLSSLRTVLRHPVVVDGRNLFDPERMVAAGFQYYCVGRPSLRPGLARAPEELAAQGSESSVSIADAVPASCPA
jgi:UDPglucose 6-dehydrogenase